MTEPTAATRASLAAAWLGLGRPLHHLAVGLMLAALLVLIPPRLIPEVRWLGCLSLVAGLGETYYALRTAFDTTLFAAWGTAWRHPGAQPDADLADFDGALPSSRRLSGRSLDDRIAGARRLLRWQGMFLLLQFTSVLGAWILR